MQSNKWMDKKQGENYWKFSNDIFDQQFFEKKNSHEERRDSIGLTLLGEKILWVLLVLANYFKFLFNTSVAPYWMFMLYSMRNNL